MTLIDTVLTMPGRTVEEEHRRRITAINAVIAFCDVEEGAPSRLHVSKRPTTNTIDGRESTLLAKRQRPCPANENTQVFHRAIVSVYIKDPN